MRKFAGLIGLVAAVGGCGLFHQAEPPAHSLPNSTMVWGNWVLSHPDSTSFAGAQVVMMSLNPGAFTLEADYPARAAVVITGTANISDAGMLTLVPSSGLNEVSGRWRALRLAAGEPLTLLASAAGNTLVFAPPTNLSDPTPSSVWHRAQAARAAGLRTSSVPRDTTKR